MRTNLTGFALTVGMGLIVILMGFGLLSAAGLAGFSASDTFAEQARQEDKQNKEQMAKGFYCQSRGSSTKTYAPTSSKEAVAIANGDALFKNNCTQCHAINERVVGPALAGITQRRPTSWIVSWVHNPAKVVASGDDYAVKLFNDYDKQQMPAFKLSERDIKDILAWINAQGGMAGAGEGIVTAAN
jgi:mono/diheme cytochrome c family protein